MTQLPDALSPDALSPDALSPDALSPDALSPDALSPDALSPDALSPDALSPDALSPDALSPDALSPDALSPDALSPDALSPDALSPDALSPDALSPDALSPDALSPDALSPDALSPDALSPDALSPDALSPDALSPDALSPDALSPDALSPDALSPDALSPDALSPDALSPDALSPDALSPDALSPDALSPDALSPDALSPDALKSQLKARAQALGFIACGVARAAPSRSASRLERWLEHGHHAGMAWMGKPESVEKRADVRRLLPGARSVVALAMLYRTDAPWDAASLGEIARYARGDDYHDWMKARLRELLEWAKAAGGGAGLACVDTAPVLEREWAQRAGLGWIGKNSLLMNRAFGSYVLLGELILEVELPPDEPHAADFCGTCTRCIDACPTNALLEPRVLDSNLCIAYHTIENRELAPLQLREDFGDQVFGCDICQQVCPWNQKAERDGVFSAEPERWTRPQLPTLHEWVALPQTEFSARLQGSPLKRAKRRGMRRNAARALKNRARKRR